MPSNEKQPKLSTGPLTNVFAELDDFIKNAVTKEEMVKTIKGMLDTMKGMDERISKNMAKSKGDSDTSFNDVRGQMQKMANELLSILRQSEAKSNASLQNATEQLQREVKRVEGLIPDFTDRINEVEAKIPELPPEKVGEDYRNALEALPEGEKLAISAIEGLEEALNKKATTGTINGGIVGRDIVKNYDLSPYLDGVTKTFNIPAVWSIISVSCSSFPTVLRPIVDYTNTPQSITFTSEIDAATTLATGQTVVLTIVTG